MVPRYNALNFSPSYFNLFLRGCGMAKEESPVQINRINGNVTMLKEANIRHMLMLVVAIKFL